MEDHDIEEKIEPVFDSRPLDEITKQRIWKKVRKSDPNLPVKPKEIQKVK